MIRFCGHLHAPYAEKGSAKTDHCYAWDGRWVRGSEGWGGRFVRGLGRLAGQHLLYGLAGDSQFAGDLGLREAFPDKTTQEVAALGVELLGQAHVPDGLVADFPQMLEGLLVGREVSLLRRGVSLFSCHAPSMTREGCHVKGGLSFRPVPAPVRGGFLLRSGYGSALRAAEAAARAACARAAGRGRGA